jgi:hypothetical protein
MKTADIACEKKEKSIKKIACPGSTPPCRVPFPMPLAPHTACPWLLLQRFRAGGLRDPSRHWSLMRSTAHGFKQEVGDSIEGEALVETSRRSVSLPTKEHQSMQKREISCRPYCVCICDFQGFFRSDLQSFLYGWRQHDRRPARVR